MNIMFIIPALCGGGAERVTATLAGAFSSEHKVYIMTYYSEETNYQYDDAVEVICLDISDGRSNLKKILNSIKRIQMLRRYKKKFNIDCAISMLSSPNFENVLSRRYEKVIVSIRNKCSMQAFGVQKLINEFTCKKADVVVALSESVKNDQINNFHTPYQKIITIYNPCDIQLIHKLSKQEVNEGEEFYSLRKKSDFMVITAGRLIDQKGQWHLIRAFSEVIKKCPNASLVILGRGELSGYLQQLIIDYKMEDKVYLMGFHTNPYPYLSKANLFAFTSIFEGFGNILLEAMACNLPIISCDCDAGPKELLAPTIPLMQNVNELTYAEFGVLSPVMDGVKYKASNDLTEPEVIFAKGIISLAEDEHLLNYYTEKSKERIKAFDTQNIVYQWKSNIL